MTARAKKYFRYLIPVSLFGTNRTKEILSVNPTLNISRKDAEKVFITIYDYDESSLNEYDLVKIEDSFSFKENKHISWINVDGLCKKEVDMLSEKYGIHPLIAEDIL